MYEGSVVAVAFQMILFLIPQSHGIAASLVLRSSRPSSDELGHPASSSRVRRVLTSLRPAPLNRRLVVYLFFRPLPALRFLLFQVARVRLIPPVPLILLVLLRLPLLEEIQQIRPELGNIVSRLPSLPLPQSF